MILLSDFAARWRKELLPDIVKGGKDLARLGIPKGAIPNYTGPIYLKPQTPKYKPGTTTPEIREKVNLLRVEDEMAKNKKGLNFKTSKDPVSHKHILPSQQKEKLLQARERADLRKSTSSSPSINTTTSVKTNVSNTTASSKVISTVENNTKKPNLLKNISKKKLGLAAAGLTTVGIIGTAITRKVRKDKNKKRGKYNLFTSVSK